MEALRDSNKELQKLYSQSLNRERESEREISRLKKKIEELQDHRKSVPPFAPPFGTPDQVPAWIPVSPPVVGGFSAGSFPGAFFVFLESTFIDQNNPKRQTAGPRRGSPKPFLVLVWVPTCWHQGN